MSVFTNPSSGAAEHATAYINAILALLGDREPISVLRDTPVALSRAVAGLSPQEMRRPERPGKWAINQILQHLADSETVWAWRVRLILAQDRPQLTPYDQDLWADRLHYALEDPANSLQTFAVLRSANLRLVERALPDDLNRVGLHAERGEESVAGLLRLNAGHDLLHLQQIERVRGAMA